MRKISKLLLTLCLLVTACSTPEPRSNNIKIGAFLSLTGATYAYGISASNAINLAAGEANANGGIDGKQIQIDIEDDESNTQQVPDVVNHLIKEHKVQALIAE